MSSNRMDQDSIHSARWAESGSTTPGDLALPLQVPVARTQGLIFAFGAVAIAVLVLLGGAVLLLLGKDADDQLAAVAALVLGSIFARTGFLVWRRSGLGLLYTFTRQCLIDHRLPHAVLRWAEVESVDVIRNRYAIVGVWFTIKGAPGPVPWRSRYIGWPLLDNRAVGGKPASPHWSYVSLMGLTVSSSLLAELILNLVRQENPGVKLEANLIEALFGGGPRLT